MTGVGSAQTISNFQSWFYDAGTGATASACWYNLGTSQDTAITLTGTTGNAYADLQYSPATVTVTVTGSSNINYYYDLAAGTMVRFYGSNYETEEQRISREQHEIIEKVKHESALKRAEELLFMALTNDQRKQYQEKEYFETLVNDRIYRIKKGRSMNIALLDITGKEKERYCIHPTDLMPAPDNMLAQLLMLRTDEAGFLKRANKSIIY